MNMTLQHPFSDGNGRTAPLKVGNASYRVSADISNNLASRDLKALTDAGLLRPAVEKRGRHYVASDAVMAIRDRHRLPRGIPDPFDGPNGKKG